MKNTMVIKQTFKPFKTGYYYSNKSQGISRWCILTDKGTCETLSKYKLPKTKGVAFVVIEEDEIEKFKKNGYYITKIATTNLFLVVDRNADSVSVDIIYDIIVNNCLPIIECECVGVHMGVVILIGTDGAIKHYRQEGLRDKKRVQRLIKEGKVSPAVLDLYELPKYIRLVSESKDVCLRRSFKEV